jgi:hypothetical protein
MSNAANFRLLKRPSTVLQYFHILPFIIQLIRLETVDYRNITYYDKSIFLPCYYISFSYFQTVHEHAILVFSR